GADLSGNPTGAHLEEAVLNEAHLEGANLSHAFLEGATLDEAYLEGADLYEAHLRDAGLWKAHLERADLRGVHLEGADLREAHLEQASLRRATFDLQTDLAGAILVSPEAGGVGPRLADIRFNGISLIVLAREWEGMRRLGDEVAANETRGAKR